MPPFPLHFQVIRIAICFEGSLSSLSLKRIWTKAGKPVYATQHYRLRFSHKYSKGKLTYGRMGLKTIKGGNKLPECALVSNYIIETTLLAGDFPKLE